MRKGIIGAVAALAILAPATTSASAGEPTATAAHSCSSGYKHAVLGGEHKCLRAGQFCAKRHQRKYHKKGLHCKANGHLKNR